MLEIAPLGVSVAVNDNAIVRLVDEVGTATDVIQVGRLATPALQLTRTHPASQCMIAGSSFIPRQGHLISVSFMLFDERLRLSNTS